VIPYPSVHVCLPSDFRAAGAARQSLRSLESYVPSETVQDLNLLVSELVTNSVKHSPHLHDQAIEIDANPTDRGIRVEVTNPGGAELSNKVRPRTSESGWGLLLVTKIASRWGVTTNGETQIWFEIDLSIPDERPVPSRPFAV
jgi:two-component sensor histidine kinase